MYNEPFAQYKTKKAVESIWMPFVCTVLLYRTNTTRRAIMQQTIFAATVCFFKTGQLAVEIQLCWLCLGFLSLFLHVCENQGTVDNIVRFWCRYGPCRDHNLMLDARKKGLCMGHVLKTINDTASQREAAFQTFSLNVPCIHICCAVHMTWERYLTRMI